MIEQTFAWRGILAKDMTREQLMEAMLELIGETDRLRSQLTQARKDAIFSMSRRNMNKDEARNILKTIRA